MPTILTVRMAPSTLAKLDRRAAEAGRERSAYVRAMIEEDVKRSASKPRHVFASRDLLGKYAIGGGSDNESVRRIVRQRLSKRAKNR